MRETYHVEIVPCFGETEHHDLAGVLHLTKEELDAGRFAFEFVPKRAVTIDSVLLYVYPWHRDCRSVECGSGALRHEVARARGCGSAVIPRGGGRTFFSEPLHADSSTTIRVSLRGSV